MPNYRFLIVLFFSCLFANAFSQAIVFEHISNEENIPQDGIFDIAQDKSGFLWLATHKGLVRYDGINTVVYEHFTSGDHLVPFDKAHRIFICENNDVLVTTKTGLCRYSRTQDKFCHERHTEHLVDVSSVLCPVSDDDDIIVSTPSGIASYAKGDTLHTIIIVDQDAVLTSHQFKLMTNVNDSLLLIAPESGGIGLAKYEHQDQCLTVLSLYTTQLRCHSIAKESDSVFWVAFHDRIKRIKLSSNGRIVDLDCIGIPKTVSAVKDIVVASNGLVYIATIGSGLLVYDMALRQSTTYLESPHKDGLMWNNLLSLCMDATGGVWIGNGQGGLSYFDTGRKPFYKLSHNAQDYNSLSHNFVNPLLIDSKGHLWAGTLRGGLNRSQEPVHNGDISELAFDLVKKKKIMRYGLYELDNYVLIGAGNALHFYNLTTGQFTTLNRRSPLAKIIGDQTIFSFAHDAEGRLWIACANALICVDYRGDIKNVLSGKCTEVPLSVDDNASLRRRTNQVLCLDNGLTLIAMNNGLFTCEPSTDTLRLKHYAYHKNDANALTHSRVTSICEDLNGQIWLGTYNGGLNKLHLHHDGSVSFSSQDISLGVNSVSDIQVDSENKLWISSDNGIFMYNSKANTSIQYSSFADQKVSNKFNIKGSAKSNAGQIFFAGNNGIVCFQPTDIVVDTTAARVELTTLKIYDQRIDVGDKIGGRTILPTSIATLDTLILPHSCKVFSIEFAALHYTAPKRNSFLYKTEGLDKNWQRASISQNVISYKQLAPGEYTLLLKALNSDHIAGQQTRVLYIKVLPPWYATWWARSIAVLLLLLVLYVIYRYILKLSTLKQSLRMESLEKEKEKELFDMKQRFFTNISHELKTPLALIIGPLERIISKNELGAAHSKSLGLILRNSFRLQHLINQILDFRRLENNKVKLNVQKANFYDLVNSVLTSFSQEFYDHNVTLSYICTNDALEFYFDYDKIEKVIYNLVSNACKHTPDNGHIEIKTVYDTEAKQVVFSVCNSGEGIAEEYKTRVFNRFYKLDEGSSGAGIGLSMAKDYVEMHKGEIKEYGTPSQSALFEFFLPLSLANEAQGELAVHSSSPTVLHEQGAGLELASERKKYTVLVVEDTADMLEFVCDIVSPHYNVLRAVDGKAGCDMAVEHIPDIIITDLMMPIVDGTQLCRRLKQEPKTCHIPIIMLTAKDTLDDKIEGLNTGADAYMSKPFRADYLQARIENILTSRSTLQALYKEKYSLLPPEQEVSSSDEILLKELIAFIEKNLANYELKVEDVANEFAYSYRQFNRKIKALTGLSVGQFISQYRLKKAKSILENDPSIRISELMVSTGFSTHSHFSKSFKELFDCTPKDFRQQLIDG